jgi:hypothetical protein
MARSTWADPTATWSDSSAPWADEGITDLAAKFEWSPSTAPGDAPVWVDITDRVRFGRISRGRQSEFDRTSAGTITLEVDNRDRAFDPWVTSTARPNKRLRATVGEAPDVVYLFDGWIDGIPQAYAPPADAVVTLTATDAFKVFARYELDAIYGPVVEADSPHGWWRLADDLPRATVVADSSGNGYTGGWKGTPTATQSLVTDGPGGVSLEGSSTDTEGSADGAVITGGTLSAAPVSIECWVRTGKYGTNFSFICGQTHVVGSTTFTTDFGLAMNNATGVPVFLAQVGGMNVAVTGTTVLRDTGVHHLVGTIDSSRVCRLYVDGVQQGGTATGGSTTTIDGTGSIRIGKTPVGADPGAGSSYKSWKGDICEVAVYSSALSAARVLAHYQAGAAPWANETTGARVGRILNLVGWPSGDRAIDTGASTLGAAQNIEGKSALDHLLAVENTEQGRFFVTGAGDVAFHSRTHEVNLTSEASFVDEEVDDLEFDFSEANLVNDCTVTREGGLPQRAQNATSIAAYWRVSESLSGLLYSTDNQAQAMAEWRVSNLSNPTLRPSRLTFKPLIDLTGSFPRVLNRELGDRITVTKTLDGSDITIDAVIEGISHDFGPGMRWKTSWNLSPLQYGQFGPGGTTGGYWRLSGPGASAETRALSRLDNNNRMRF